MHPDFFTIPIIGVSIKTYGFFLMVGFLSAVWLAMRRAQRVKANPDTVLDLSILSLLFGVGGARLFYVVHYWQTQFAPAPNRFLAVIDIRGGGLEFLGGFLGALVVLLAYTAWKKLSVRMYLDILAPSVMWGLAFGRVGCFFNGCCFGGLCVTPATGQPEYSWATSFPFASPAHRHQWDDRDVTVPAELITTIEGLLQSSLVDGSLLSMSVEQRDGPKRRHEDARREYQRAKAEAPSAASTTKLKAKLDALAKAKKTHDVKLAMLSRAQRFPSRLVPTRVTSVTELEQLAALHRSLPIHPTQLYSSIQALLLSAVLSGLFYLRKRHGVVIGALFVLYPLPRMILELIRADNPHDVGGLTASQSVSFAMLAAGLVYLVVLYKWLPQRSLRVDQEAAAAQTA